MTYKELKDSIIARYKMDATTRGVPYVKLQDAWIYQLITQAESDIQRRILPLTISITADIGTDFAAPLPNNGGVGVAEQYWVLYPIDSITQAINGIGNARPGYDAMLYGLPLDCGKIRQISTSEQDELIYKTPEEFNVIEANNAEGMYYTTYRDGTSNVLKLYPIPENTTMTLLYYKAIIPFIDNSLTENSDLQLAPEYYTAIEYKVMSNIFRDYIDLYEMDMQRLKEYHNISTVSEIEGNLGGY